MKSERLHPLPDEVLALLKEERSTFQQLAPGVADDLAQRLGPLLGAPGAAPPHGGSSTPPTTPPSATAAPVVGTAGKMGALKVAALLAVGASLGAGATITLRSAPKPEIRYVEIEKIVERPAALPPVASATGATPPSTQLAPARPPSPASSTPTISDKALARERTLIETARSAVSRGDGPAALEAVRTHAQEFPQGRLVEEREALAVQALMLSGRTDEGRARANQFKKRFPNGLFLPVVDAALEK